MGQPAAFAFTLKQRRKALDLTQPELAQRVGCAVVTIQRLEQGTMRPSRQLAQRLAAKLDLSADERAQFVRLARSGAASVDGSPTSFDTGAGASSPWPLPAPLTPLIGRAREVATVCTVLENPTVRVLTLTGPGGIGKTRLALQVAADLEAAFADGARFVDLAPIHDPGLVPTTIAQTLGLTDVDGRPLLARLQRALHDKHLLLLLDNFEHVTAAAPMVAELLAAAPRLQVLITSRVVAGVYGEHDVPVPPLTLPDLQAAARPDQLMQVEAVRLFVERAQAATPDFCLTRANAHVVSEICRQLDGLPLAIELAAARVRLLPPTLLLHHVAQSRAGRLTVLTGGPRTVPARQQTLRDTLSWSYNLLAPAEQQLYRRLAVFVGGSTLEAVAAVCTMDGDLAVDVLAGLQALLDHSLLQRREGVAGEPRFTMLETIREYALERLGASGERERLQRQHAAYCVTLAESGDVAAGGCWWDRLEEEHGNFRAALAWSRTEVGSDTGLRLAVALSKFWARRGHLREGSGWLAQVTQPRAAGAGAGSSTWTQVALQAQALGQLGMFAQWQGDLDAAVAANAASLALFRQIEEPVGIVNALNTLGMAYQLRGDHERAGVCLQESLIQAQALGDAHPVIGWCHFFLGTLAYTEGHMDRAGALWEDSLMRLRVTRDTWSIATILAHAGMVALSQGDDRRAAGYLAESLTGLQELGERWQSVHALEVVARLAAEQAQRAMDTQPDVARVARIFGAAEALRETFGAPALAFQRHSYQRGIAALRAHPDQPTVAAAWAEGRLMSLEQAIDYALAALERTDGAKEGIFA